MCVARHTSNHFKLKKEFECRGMAKQDKASVTQEEFLGNEIDFR